MQTTKNTRIETTGLTLTLDVQEAHRVLSALDRQGNQIDLVDPIREALGMTTYMEMAREAIGEGHYDNDLLEGRTVSAIKRLRQTLPSFGLKAAKDLMVERRDLLREANREIDRLRHRLTCDLAPWECELLNGTTLHND